MVTEYYQVVYLYSLFSSESFITLITYWQFYPPVAIGNWLLSTGVFIFPLLTNCWTNHGTKLEDAGGPQSVDIQSPVRPSNEPSSLRQRRRLSLRKRCLRFCNGILFETRMQISIHNHYYGNLIIVMTFCFIWKVWNLLKVDYKLRIERVKLLKRWKTTLLMGWKMLKSRSWKRT